MIGRSWIRKRGRREKSGTIRSFRPLVLTASQLVDCSRISTRSRVRYRSLRGIRNIRARGGATVPRVRRHLIRLPIPIEFSSHSNAPENAVKENGNAPRGMKHSTRLPRVFATPLSKIDGTRSCITSAAQARTASRNAFSRPGESTDTTHTQTSARPAVVKVINSGWDSIVPVRITQTQKSSC